MTRAHMAVETPSNISLVCQTFSISILRCYRDSKILISYAINTELKGTQSPLGALCAFRCLAGIMMSIEHPLKESTYVKKT